jgi:hypothetical protein
VVRQKSSCRSRRDATEESHMRLNKFGHFKLFWTEVAELRIGDRERS